MQKIAYFGPSGTFTEAALAQMQAERRFADADAVERVPATAPGAALELVRRGEVAFACVPLASSVDGLVAPTLDALAISSRLQIYAETWLDVSFTVVSRQPMPDDAVRTIGAYPVAAAQVREWVACRYPNATVMPATSNAGAAEDVAAGKVDLAVSTGLAAERLGLHVVATNVADVLGARTRFALVGAPGAPPPPAQLNRSAVVLRVANQPGGLAAAIGEFAARGVDMTYLESRPQRDYVEHYYFFVEFRGHISEDATAQVLLALRDQCEDVRYLGSWPAYENFWEPSGVKHHRVVQEDARAWLARMREGASV